MTLYKWSQTAASDATADASINWQEGQSPSSVNDSARAMMAATAKYRDDIAGAIVTGGSATAYTVASYQVFDTLAHMNGAMIAFTPHATNTGSTGCTLNVDGLGAKALRSSPSVELPSGTLILGTPYVATYSNADGAWYLQGGAANVYSAPLGGGMLYFGTTAPNSAFAFPYGQALSRTTYASLFSLIGATFGGGDGSTTFSLPDLRGRVPAGVDSMGGSAAGLLTAASGMGTGVLGQSGGTETITLLTTNLPPYTPTGVITNGGITITQNALLNNNGSSVAAGGNASPSAGSATITASQATSTFTGGGQGGNSTAVKNVQPTICCNFIMRVI